MPIFKWSKITPPRIDASSAGARPPALRVFMARPWWTSGVGELLGVVTHPGAEDTSAHARSRRPTSCTCSDWGARSGVPRAQAELHCVRRLGLWRSAVAAPAPESFPARVANGTGSRSTRTHTSASTSRATTSATTRCATSGTADILVDFGNAYTPMLRLALARYQPDSVTGVELSRIVLADVMSLEPARIVSIVRSRPSCCARSRSPASPTAWTATRSGTGPGLATLVVERRRPRDPRRDARLGAGRQADRYGRPRPTRRASPSGRRATSRSRTATAGCSSSQYEVIPTDRRTENIDIAYFPSDGLRLLYQDLIPL